MNTGECLLEANNAPLKRRSFSNANRRLQTALRRQAFPSASSAITKPGPGWKPADRKMNSIARGWLLSDDAVSRSWFIKDSCISQRWILREAGFLALTTFMRTLLSFEAVGYTL